MIFASKDELGCQRAGLRWWEILHGVRSRVPGMVSLVSKTYFDSRAFSIIGRNGQRATKLIPLESKASTEGLKQHE